MFRRSNQSALVALLILSMAVVTSITPGAAGADTPPEVRRVAVLTTLWRRLSHADVIAGRILQSDTFDDRGRRWPLKIVSAYVDQVGSDDLSRKMADRYGFEIAPTLEAALTLNGDQLAVDGVLVICEHGDYPESPTGQIVYPKRKFFEAVYRVFDRSGRVVPVFNDKHIADNWTDARWIVEEAERRKVPMIAGSSVPTWRRVPETAGPRGEEVAEACVLYYGGPEIYGFHAVDLGQALFEQRSGGETGVSKVRVRKGRDVWPALREHPSAPALVAAALSRDPTAKPFAQLEQSVSDPLWFEVHHRNGLVVHYLMLNGATREFVASWRLAGSAPGSVSASVQCVLDDHSGIFRHFGTLTDQISHLVTTGKPPFPVRRTLLSSTILHEMMTAYTRNELDRPTPHLDWGYESNWVWTPPADKTP
jgi:hypothetical protein